MELTLTLKPDLGAALQERARREGLPPEALVLRVLREQFVPGPALPEPRDDWERLVLSMGQDCGVSLPNEAVSSEGIYE